MATPTIRLFITVYKNTLFLKKVLDTVLFAKRTNLDQKTSEELLKSSIIVPSKWKMLQNGSTRIEDSIRLPFKPIFTTKKPKLLGCNMAIPLAILKAINGFDEDYEMTGYGEDCDIEWRILKAGFIFKNLKYHKHTISSFP